MDENATIKTILFDFDGTLADTVRAGVAAFNQLAERYGFSEITEENADVLRTNGPRAAMKALHVPMYRVPLVLRHLRSDIRASLPSFGFTDGMRAAILELKEKGYRLGIVTSNSEENVNEFLQNNKAEFFDFIHAGAGVFNKAGKIKRLLLDEGLKNHETIFVGDEIRDMEAAHKNGMVCIAVTWGINSREGLAGAEPDFIVDTATELVDLFAVVPADLTDVTVSELLAS